MKNRAIKYRIYPDAGQIDKLEQTFGCCRKIWNLMLTDIRSGSILHPTPAQYKDSYPYLRNVDSLALANVQLNLKEAIKRPHIVKGAGMARFKSKKRSKRSYTTNNQKGSIRIDANAGTIRLPKVNEIKAVLHRLPGKEWIIKSATVSEPIEGRFYCSVLFEYEEETGQVEHPELKAVGLDYKSNGLFVSSESEVCGSPKFYQKSRKKLAVCQRRLSKKVKGSKGYEKQKAKVAKLHGHVSNQRRDFLHKKSAEIANRYDMVCVEDLDLIEISRKKGKYRLGKYTLDNGYGTFCTFLEYKLHDRGKVFVKISKWYPSSQNCSCCGYQNQQLKDLSITKWDCPVCDTHHDRDINAAINIRNEGIRQYCAA